MKNDFVLAKTAARVCGFESVAMLDYLQRSGVFVPVERKATSREKGRGTRRTYSFRELIVLRTISTLLKNGASVSALKGALNDFQKAKWDADRGSMQFNGEAARYFVVSNGEILFAKSEDKLFSLTRDGQMVFGFLVDLDRVHTEVRFALDQSPLPFPKVA